MTRREQRDLLIGLAALLAMAGVAWMVYHYNMRSNFAEIHCQEVARQCGSDTPQYENCITQESARFAATKSEIGRRKELSEFATQPAGR